MYSIRGKYLNEKTEQPASDPCDTKLILNTSHSALKIVKQSLVGTECVMVLKQLILDIKIASPVKPIQNTPKLLSLQSMCLSLRVDEIK